MTPEQIITQALDDYESLLISYAREITGELESAKDAVQETFLRLSSQNLNVLQPRLRPWLFVVCRNCALHSVTDNSSMSWLRSRANRSQDCHRLRRRVC